jgi:hypothetical protein
MPKSTNIKGYDVIIAGAGPGGLPAAIAAARLGAKTLLIEKNNHLGGMAASGLPFLAFIDRAGNRVVGGIAQEFIEKLDAVGGTLGHIPCPIHNSTTPVNPFWFRVIASEMCEEAGVDVVFSADVVDVPVEQGKITGIKFLSRSKFFKAQCKVLVDATGDGSVIHLSGAHYAMGDPEKGECQPASLVFSVGNVDLEAFISYLKENPKTFELPDTYGVRYNLDYFLKSKGFYFTGFGEFIEIARQNNEFDIQRDRVILQTQPNPGEILVNATRILGADPTDPIGFSRLEAQANRQVHMLMHFFRKYCPGFQDAFLANIHNGVGVRESRRMVGLNTLTRQDVENLTINDDSIALAGYNVDIHEHGKGLYLQPVEHAVGIPYGCLVSKNIEGLLASGRLISADRHALGLARVISTCMAIGEAAGTAAAICVSDHYTPASLPVPILQKKLVGQGAVIKL